MISLAIIIAAIASMVIGSAGAILGLLVGLGFIAPAMFAQGAIIGFFG